MNYIYIGTIVNTHGIKGEVRILSHFKYKNLVFTVNTPIYIGSNHEKVIIKSYRSHKVFDMVTFVGIDDINDVLKYKGEKVYIDRNEVKIDGILNEDLIDMEVFGNGNFIGHVTEVVSNGVYDILVVDDKGMIPNISEFILNIDLDNNRIDVNLIEGLINEN